MNRLGLRIDMVDVARWRAAVPLHKFVGHIFVGLVLGSVVVAVIAVGRAACFVANWVQGQITATLRWSGFIGGPLDPEDVPGPFEVTTTAFHGDDSTNCAICERDTDMAIRMHVRCWQGMLEGETLSLSGPIADKMRRASDALRAEGHDPRDYWIGVIAAASDHALGGHKVTAPADPATVSE